MEPVLLFNNHRLKLQHIQKTKLLIYFLILIIKIMTNVPKGDSGFPNLLKEESENILNDEDNKEKESKQGEEQ